MMERIDGKTSQLFVRLINFLVKCLSKILSIGPIPDHIAFIMDGNRRYAKRHNTAEGGGHKAGYSSLMSMLMYCYELGVKHVTVYAFSIDNFKRRPEEVQYLMDLTLEKIEVLLLEQEGGILNQYGVRVYFIGNLKLLNEPVRFAAEKLMIATAKNNKAVLLVCVAYTSSDEIVHAIKESCENKRREIHDASKGVEEDKNLHKGLIVNDDQESREDELQGSDVVERTERISDKGKGNSDDIATRTSSGLIEEDEVRERQRKLPSIRMVDVEKHMYTAVAPDPDIVIRSSGETSLSNFLLWQSANCLLYSPAALWPELGLRHMVWAVLNFQRSYQYLEKKRKSK